jgi:DeoR family ulaG and ulaABCDEF operon transcriptional repressor
MLPDPGGGNSRVPPCRLVVPGKRQQQPDEKLMLEQQRHRLILDLLDEKQFVRLQELVETLNASAATIRRDINKLAGEGLLTKIHGGAQLPESAQRPPRQQLQGAAFLASLERHVAQKRAIAERAVAMCRDGETVLINGGSSTFMMAEFLCARDVNVLTNSFALAGVLIESGTCRVTLPGGELYRKQNIIVSAFDEDLIQRYHGRWMFMGTPAIGPYGVMESDPLLIQAEQKLLRQAEQLVVLADSSKIGARAQFRFCGLEEVDILITDAGIDAASRTQFEDAGIEVIVVETARDDAAGHRDAEPDAA